MRTREARRENRRIMGAAWKGLQGHGSNWAFIPAGRGALEGHRAEEGHILASALKSHHHPGNCRDKGRNWTGPCKEMRWLGVPISLVPSDFSHRWNDHLGHHTDLTRPHGKLVFSGFLQRCANPLSPLVRGLMLLGAPQPLRDRQVSAELGPHCLEQ